MLHNETELEEYRNVIYGREKGSATDATVFALFEASGIIREYKSQDLSDYNQYLQEKRKRGSGQGVPRSGGTSRKGNQRRGVSASPNIPISAVVKTFIDANGQRRNIIHGKTPGTYMVTGTRLKNYDFPTPEEAIAAEDANIQAYNSRSVRYAIPESIPNQTGNEDFESIFFSDIDMDEDKEKPTLKDRILDFFRTTKHGDEKLDGAAKKLYGNYKKLFDEFAARNQGNNAFLNTAVPMDTTVGDQMRYAQIEEKVNDAVDRALRLKGKLDEKYNQVQISAFPAEISTMVNAASEGRIVLEGKQIAINGADLWHEYRRHNDETDEISRRQVPLTPATMTEAIMAIYSPDMVESIFTTSDNPTQRQSFAYAKKSPNGYYIVVEAVGGKRNPNVVPVMLLQFNEKKWNDMIASGATLGEILYENDPEKRSHLDVGFNKKNRVTAAQFASEEAIASTPRSPRFSTTSIPQPPKMSTLNRRELTMGHAMRLTK